MIQVSNPCFTGLLCLLAYAVTAQSALWERTYPQLLNDYPHATAAFDTSGFTIAGFLLTPDIIRPTKGFIFKVDRQGEILWGRKDTIQYKSIAPTQDSGYILLGSQNNNTFRRLIQKINKLGREQWLKRYNDFDEVISAVLPTQDLGYVVLGIRHDSLYLNKLDALGNSRWIKLWKVDTLGGFSSSFGVSELSDAGFLINAFNSNRRDSSTMFMRTDAFGNSLWRKAIFSPNLDFIDNVSLNVQNGKITYMAGNLQAAYLYQLDIQGNLLRTVPFYMSYWIRNFNFVKRRSGGYWLNYRQPNGSGGWKEHLWRLDADGIPVSHKTFSKQYNDYYLSGFAERSDTTLFFYGLHQSNIFMMVTDTNGLVYRNLIQGTLISSCTPNFANWAVRATRTDGSFFHTRTDANSRFEIAMDTGTYTIQAHPPTADWSSNPRTLHQPNLNRIDTIPLIINCLTNCPNLNVDITIPIMRRCFPNEHTIRYCNNGTIPATNAYIEVKLDSLSEYLSSSIPVASRIGQTLRFNIGTIAMNTCNNFTISVRTACGDSTQLRQSLCTSVHIYPDTICVNPPNWTGANLFVTGACERDSVRFTIANLGRSNSSLLRRTVIDNANITSNTQISIPANGRQTMRFPANGHTWRVSVEQEPNHPYGNTPMAAIEGCRTNPNTPISMFFINQLPFDTRNPVQKTVCTILRGSYDPNDKMSFPTGYGANQWIEANQDIEYMVRFQNTGTDTAFTVVVKDTLSNFLDALSVQPLASSHRYEWTVLKNNILQFTFPNILLVDSFRNEPKSHGFIKFHIKQKPNVALGSTIYNQAAIYFDFNAPVITNRTWLTIGKQFIISGVSDEASKWKMRFLSYPNPTIDHAVLEILDGNDDNSIRNFQLLDATGRIVRQDNFKGNRYEFGREGLNAGFYFFRVEQQGQLLGTGRIVIQ